MDIDISKLKKYDTEHAEAGDKLIWARRSSYGNRWAFSRHIIKSVSTKRGNITLDNGVRFDHRGQRYGGRQKYYDTREDVILELDQENETKIIAYAKHRSLVFKTRKVLETLLKNECSRLEDMPTEKIEQFYEIVKDFAEGE